MLGMFKFIFALIMFLSLDAVTYCAEGADSKDVVARELAMLEDHIEGTRCRLVNLEQLRDSIKQYQSFQLRYLQGKGSQHELLYQMVQAADLIMKNIKENRLNQLFDPAFISELTIMSKPAGKRGIPKP